jgi:hypothetical protein
LTASAALYSDNDGGGGGGGRGGGACGGGDGSDGGGNIGSGGCGRGSMLYASSGRCVGRDCSGVGATSDDGGMPGTVSACNGDCTAMFRRRAVATVMPWASAATAVVAHMGSLSQVARLYFSVTLSIDTDGRTVSLTGALCGNVAYCRGVVQSERAGGAQPLACAIARVQALHGDSHNQIIQVNDMPVKLVCVIGCTYCLTATCEVFLSVI